ncbi:hypothetical protein EUX98_g462 [Antrodiella citrinella]|uniref:Transcription elongation factor Eaf N-terminal domain-containing protein n=1 Tax=Antrodiella citrinella TaxID=2447956 RepID=A0A4S4N711_9APHY|nr:hypothetical protein EUX98_g462 [Antrodiella citrinella]
MSIFEDEQLDQLDPLRHLRRDDDDDTLGYLVPVQPPSILNQDIELGGSLPQDIPSPDIILAADCVYFEPAFPLLVKTLVDLASQGTPEILFCYKKRRKADKRFFTLLKREFTWSEVADDPNRDVYSRDAISLLKLVRKRMTSIDNTWCPPPPGIYDVKVGSSLSKALKARKGETVRTKVEKELYSFRYNFRPESVDNVTNGTLNVKKGDDKDVKVTVERAAQADSGGYSFAGKASPAKEYDCVIIYDPLTLAFTLEKVDSSLMLTYDRKTAHGPRSAVSPLPVGSANSSRPSTSSSGASSAQPLSRSRQIHTTIEDNGGHDEDAEGEPDDDFMDVVSVTAKAPASLPKRPVTDKDAPAPSNGKGKQAAPKRKTKSAATIPAPAPPPARVSEESEPEEALSKQVRPLPPAVPVAKGKAAAGAKTARPKKSGPMAKAEKAAMAASTAFRSFPKPRISQLPSQPAVSGSTSTTNQPASSLPALLPSASGTKREREAETPAVRPTPQPRPKRQKIVPTSIPKPEKTKEPFSLALPTGSEFSLPSSVSAPTGLPAGASSSVVPTPSPPNESAAQPADDSEEEEWDEPVRAIQMEVIIPTAAPHPDPMETVDNSDGLAAGDDDFLLDMFDEAAEDDAPEDDFLQDAMEEASEVRAPPKTMAELAQTQFSGADVDDPLWPDDDEDDTSDDTSDDD